MEAGLVADRAPTLEHDAAELIERAAPAAPIPQASPIPPADTAAGAEHSTGLGLGEGGRRRTAHVRVVRAREAPTGGTATV